MIEPKEIWLWQRIVSPHMVGLAKALAARGCRVVFVAERVMSATRRNQGWTVPELGGVELRLAPTSTMAKRLATSSPEGAIHLCEGIWRNGVVRAAQKALTRLGRSTWIVMETVDDRGWRGPMKRQIYRWHFSRRKHEISGILATGLRTRRWVEARGFDAEKIYPFSYFLPEVQVESPAVDPGDRQGPFEIVFAGQFVSRKRLDLLIESLGLFDSRNTRLVVVGSGPLERSLRNRAERELPGELHWLGRLPMEQVRVRLASSDCLVLPSLHDGWGAVVIEALMAGTPAICSDGCGSAEAVLASGFGGVFPNGDAGGLARLLETQVSRGRITPQKRQTLGEWARSFGADAGAEYLLRILEHHRGFCLRPNAPWISDR